MSQVAGFGRAIGLLKARRSEVSALLRPRKLTLGNEKDISARLKVVLERGAKEAIKIMEVDFWCFLGGILVFSEGWE